MLRCQAWISMALLLLGILLAPVVNAGSVMNQYRWNYNMKGDIVVLSYDSLRYYGRAPPMTATPDLCRDACSWTAGCNGWTFCNSTEGCGSGCKSYLQTHPVLPEANDHNYMLPESTTMADLQRPGPFQSLCKIEYSTWTPTEQWTWRLCTLKNVARASNPGFWSTDPAEGWISGTFEVPSKCGLTIAPSSCDKCTSLTSSTAVQGCIDCAKLASKNVPNHVVQMLINQRDNKYPVLTHACPKCYELRNSADQKTCVSCVANNKYCGSCAWADAFPWTYASLGWAVGPCLKCMQGAATAPLGQVAIQDPYQAAATGTKAVFGACRECAYTTLTSAQQQVCQTCVKSVTPKRLCTVDYSNEDKDCVPQQSCKMCATSSAQQACFQCLQRKPFNKDCWDCAEVDTTRQSACFACASKEKGYTPQGLGSGCAYCSRLPVAVGPQADDCMNNCALNKDLKVSVPRWLCTDCQTGRDRTGWNKCYTCLVQNPTSYAQKCGVS